MKFSVRSFDGQWTCFGGGIGVRHNEDWNEFPRKNISYKRKETVVRSVGGVEKVLRTELELGERVKVDVII